MKVRKNRGWMIPLGVFLLVAQVILILNMYRDVFQKGYGAASLLPALIGVILLYKGIRYRKMETGQDMQKINKHKNLK